MNYQLNEIYTIKEVAELFRTDTATIKDMIYQEKLKAKKVGNGDDWIISGKYIEDFFIEHDNKQFAEVDLNYLKLELEKRIADLDKGTVFIVKDLMDELWDQVSHGDKLSLGRWLINEVKSKRISDVEVGNKTSGHTQTYKKV